MQILATAKILFQLFPYIIEAVKLVETMFPDPKSKGSIKLQMVHNILAAIYDSIDDIWEPVTKIIAGIVAAYNATEVFKQ